MEALACSPWRPPPNAFSFAPRRPPPNAFSCAPLRPSFLVVRILLHTCHWKTSPMVVALASVRSCRCANRMFVFGVGYVGRYVSEQLKREGWHVSGTCRHAIKKRELQELGFDAFLFEMDNSKLRTLSTLNDATHMLISIPPTAGFGDPLLCLNEDMLCLLSGGNLQWLGYLSTTSVYGDCGGGWVDEEYPVNPTMEPAKSRLAAEKGWLQLGFELGVSVFVFRLGGIYGPGRSALNTILQKKSPSKRQRTRESRSYTSRIHVADIYRSIKASFNAPYSRRIYNVVDDDPSPRAEVFAFARRLIKKKWPELIIDSHDDDDDDDNDDLRKAISTSEKRVSNALLKRELGVRLVFPNYKEGLESIISSMDLPS